MDTVGMAFGRSKKSHPEAFRRARSPGTGCSRVRVTVHVFTPGPTDKWCLRYVINRCRSRVSTGPSVNESACIDPSNNRKTNMCASARAGPAYRTTHNLPTQGGWVGQTIQRATSESMRASAHSNRRDKETRDRRRLLTAPSLVIWCSGVGYLFPRTGIPLHEFLAR